MKAKVLVFVLAVSVAGFAQSRGHGGTMPSQAGSMGSHGSAGSHGSMSGDHGPGMGSANASSTHKPSQLGKQSPDTILSRNTKLASNLEKLLPAGTTAQQACTGFKNLGQCVAAIHVSNNLGIPFDQLKGKMVGDNAESLGKAITELKPDANAKAETKKANKQANQDLTESESNS